METVSKEQSQSDVSLLFRTLQSAYGAYEYFGQEKFDAAEDAVTQWLSSQDDEIKVSALGEKLQESLAFMLAHDAHAMIYEPAAEEIEAQCDMNTSLPTASIFQRMSTAAIIW